MRYYSGVARGYSTLETEHFYVQAAECYVWLSMYTLLL
jgi:hypothetical protein